MWDETLNLLPQIPNITTTATDSYTNSVRHYRTCRMQLPITFADCKRIRDFLGLVVGSSCELSNFFFKILQLTFDKHVILFFLNFSGFMLLLEAAANYGLQLNYGGIALMWRGGCIIRSAFLGKIKSAFDSDPELVRLYNYTRTCRY